MMENEVTVRNEYLITIVMPIYNICEKKLFIKAVNSVLNQTYQNIEFLMINDGSTDGTKEYLAKLEKEDNRIKSINKPNGGVESARRMGIKYATGDFIFHMDQDDLLNRNALMIMVNKALEFDADIVVGESLRFIGCPFIHKKKNINHGEIVLNHQQFIDKYYHGFFGQSIFPVQIWNKLYRKSYLDTLKEPPMVGMYHEDLNYNMHVLPQASSIVWLPDITYYYRWGGFTAKKIENLDEVALSCYRIKMDKIEELHLEEFIYSTCVELLNYMNSVFVQESIYGTQENLRTLIDRIMVLPEMEKAIEVVRNGSYRNTHIDYMIKRDVIGLMQYIVKYNKKTKWRRRIMSIFIKSN